MRSAAMQYIQEVNRQLLCPRSIKKPFLCQLEKEVSCFCADHPDTTTEALIQAFGLPEEVVEEFLSELGGQTARRCANIRRQLFALAVGVILIASTLAAIIDSRTDTLRQTLPSEKIVASITYCEESENSSSYFPAQDTIFDSR